jgi:hypothetical protein
VTPAEPAAREPQPTSEPAPPPAQVQPDLFGGADVTPGKRRARARRP